MKISLPRRRSLGWSRNPPRDEPNERLRGRLRGNGTGTHPMEISIRGFHASYLLQLSTNRFFRRNGKQPWSPTLLLFVPLRNTYLHWKKALRDNPNKVVATFKSHHLVTQRFSPFSHWGEELCDDPNNDCEGEYFCPLLLALNIYTKQKYRKIPALGLYLFKRLSCWAFFGGELIFGGACFWKV